MADLQYSAGSASASATTDGFARPVRRKRGLLNVSVETRPHVDDKGNTPHNTNSFFNVTPYIKTVQWASDQHGFADCILDITFLADRSFRWAARHMGRVYISGDGDYSFLGYVRDIRATKDGVRLIAFGGWRFLSDFQYTAFWSSNRLEDWRLLSVESGGGSSGITGITADPGKFKTDKSGRLYATVPNGERSGAKDAAFGIDAFESAQAGGGVANISFTYNMGFVAGGVLTSAKVETRSYGGEGWTGAGTLDNTLTVNATTTTLVGTASVDLSDSESALISFTPEGGGIFTGTTGETFAEITAVRAKFASGTNSVTGQDIIANLLVESAQGDWVTDTRDSGRVADPGFDILNAIYVDESPVKVAQGLESIGDGAGTQWRLRFWGRIAEFQAQGFNQRHWVAVVPDFRVESRIDNIPASIRVTYDRKDGGRVLVSGVNTPGLLSRALFRRQTETIDTKTTADAEALRDFWIDTTDMGETAAKVTVTEIFDRASRVRGDLREVRAGDTITISSVPPSMGSAGGETAFEIGRATLTKNGTALQLEPETGERSAARQIAGAT